MGHRCKEVEYWDVLIRKCMHCDSVCQQPDVISKCTSYCDYASCEAKPGHYYDRLLKKCIKCAEICGKHPAECSQHCSTLPPPVTTKMLLTEVPKKAPNSRVLLTKTDDFSILLYSLLAVSMLFVFISLALALVAFLKGRRAKLRSTEPTAEPQHRQNCVVQPGTKLEIPVGLATMSPNDFQTTSGSRSNCEQPDDSSPTETCVCVHCFPDLRTLGQDSQRPLRGPYSFYQQAVLHKANIPKSEPVCTEETIHSSGLRVQEEAYAHHKNI